MLTKIRKQFRTASIGKQLAFSVSIAVLALALFTAALSTLLARKKMEDHLKAQGLHITQTAAAEGASLLAILYHSAENVDDVKNSLLNYPDVKQVVITDSGGAVLVSAPDSHFPTNEYFQLRSEVPIVEFEDENSWVFSSPIIQKTDHSAPFAVSEEPRKILGHVHVFMSKDALNKISTTILLVSLLISTTVAIVILMVMRAISRQIIQPLRALSRLMSRAEHGESGMRAAEDGPRDIADMSAGFNKMMSGLEERETELKASRDQAVRVALACTQYAATLSHEVRTPLNGIVGMLDLLKNTSPTKRQEELIGIAWRSVHSLLDMLNEILDFSKMEAGKMELVEADFDLRQLVDELVDLFDKQAHQRGLTVGYVISPTVPDRIKGDALRLRQILLNLLGNAVKFTEHGEIAVRVSCVHKENEELELHFDVADTGIGMTQDVAGQIFQSFTQGGKSTSHKYGGSGLGLAICRQLVELMGGLISVKSVPGEGSTFSFSVQCKPADPVPLPDSDNDLLGTKVLIVEESQVTREFLLQHLQDQGMVCTAVGDGTEALARLAEAQAVGTEFGLVVADTEARDDLGLSFIRRARSDGLLSHSKVLLLDLCAPPYSASYSDGTPCLGKPLRSERVIAAVTRALQIDDSKPIEEDAGVNEEHASADSDYRVLVAEDNRTNQIVVSAMLSRLGCACDLAANGRLAVAAAAKHKYDLILMDCSMPEMDGFEATAHIRIAESPESRRTPIIALTANSQAGEREKCLAAGMDDFLAKPLTLHALSEMLKLWIPGRAKEMFQPSLFSDSDLFEDDGGPLDMAVFRQMHDIVGPALQQTVGPFIEDTAHYLDQLEEALDRGNAVDAGIAAHAIRGSSANIGASRLARHAKSAEQFAANANLEAIQGIMPLLREEFREVTALLEQEMDIDEEITTAQSGDAFKVMVADDDRSTRISLRLRLQNQGFDVVEAANGFDVLRLVETTKPNVILMDAKMPEMDGFTACEKLQEMPSGRAVPVLMVTALDDCESIDKAFAAGASDYIPKPINYTVLLQRLRRIIHANQAEERLRRASHKDPLTGLPSRSVFVESLADIIHKCQQEGSTAIVLLVNIDGFKSINATHGIAVGDQLLVDVAQRICRQMPEAETIARLAGDEFAVVVPGSADPNDAAATAQSLGRVLANPYHVDDSDVVLTVSIGVAMIPGEGKDVGSVLKGADTAMQRAKARNSGFQLAQSDADQSVCDAVRLESDLRGALRRDELEVLYQPIARTGNMASIGFEALVRWNHPRLGVLLPKEFIPLSEEIGAINSIGEWVLRVACTDIKTLINRGMEVLSLAVNISIKQLLLPDFPDTVREILAETGFPASQLTFDLTESVLMTLSEEHLHVLQDLRALGIHLAIDDFGTGFSVLSYLKRFPVEVVKVDRALVRDLPHEESDCNVISNIVELAHDLDLQVLAEGVESEAQRTFLLSAQCDMVQGYLIGEPVCLGEIEDHYFPPADDFSRAAV